MSGRVTTTTLTGALTASLVFAVGGGKAVYIGGTLPVKEKTEAVLELKCDTDMVFLDKGNPVSIPWERIDEAEYGQKVGHRIKSAIFLSPIALFSKARHHFVTFSWKDKQDHEQAAVFEFDKGDIRTALAIIRARTGKEIVYQDEEARKQMGGATVARPAPAAQPAAASAPVAAAQSAPPTAAAPAASEASVAPTAPEPEAKPSPQP